MAFSIVLFVLGNVKPIRRAANIMSDEYKKPRTIAAFNAYGDMVYRLALTRVRSKNDAEDVVQDVFIRYLKCEKRFMSDEHVKAWLIRVTINVANTLLVSPFRKALPLSNDISYVEKESSGVYQSVLRLPKKYRAVVHLFYYEDMTVEQIARALKLSVANVKVRLYRARKMLQKEYIDV